MKRVSNALPAVWLSRIFSLYILSFVILFLSFLLLSLHWFLLHRNCYSTHSTPFRKRVLLYECVLCMYVCIYVWSIMYILLLLLNITMRLSKLLLIDFVYAATTEKEMCSNNDNYDRTVMRTTNVYAHSAIASNVFVCVRMFAHTTAT